MPCAVPLRVDTPSLSDHSPSLVGGAITLDDASFTTNVDINNGTTASTAFSCVPLLALIPLRLLSYETSWSRCYWLTWPPFNSRRTLLFVPGGDSANLLPCELRQASVERPVLTGWSADELPRRVDLRRFPLSYVTRGALGAP